jgi:hypothetical protein
MKTPENFIQRTRLSRCDSNNYDGTGTDGWFSQMCDKSIKKREIIQQQFKKCLKEHKKRMCRQKFRNRTKEYPGLYCNSKCKCPRQIAIDRCKKIKTNAESDFKQSVIHDKEGNILATYTSTIGSDGTRSASLFDIPNSAPAANVR